MNGYKVRLDDGSEIGPLDLASVRTWYQDGLLNAESLVLAPGSRRWCRLRQAVDLRAWGPARLGTRRKKGQAEAAESKGGRSKGPSAPLRERIQQPTAGVLLIAGAVLAGFWRFFPAHERAALREWPWLQVGLGFLALGLLLFLQRRFTHMLAFLVLPLSAVVAVGVAGLLFMQKAPLVSYLVIGSGLVVCAGLLLVLWGHASSIPRLLLGVLVAAAGYAGAIKVGYVAAGDPEYEMYQWVEPGTEAVAGTLGVRLHLPPGWCLLKTDAPLLGAPEGALAGMARSDGSAFAYLTATTVPRGEFRLEPLLEDAIAARRQAVPTLTPRERADLKVAGLPARRMLGQSGGVEPVYELILIWRAGFTLYTLVGWGTAAQQTDLVATFDTLTAGIETAGDADGGVAQAVAAAAVQVPFLSDAMSERLMQLSESRVLEPPELFKRAQRLAGAGIPQLQPGEVKEMKQILDAVYRKMEWGDRKRLGAYLDRVRSGQLVMPDEDRQMCALMQEAVSELPEPSQQRLRQLYDAALSAALATTP